MMLEEQLREAEVRHEERQAEEQRRNRELIARIEREKQLTVENYTIKWGKLSTVFEICICLSFIIQYFSY